MRKNQMINDMKLQVLIIITPPCKNLLQRKQTTIYLYVFLLGYEM